MSPRNCHCQLVISAWFFATLVVLSITGHGTAAIHNKVATRNIFIPYRHRPFFSRAIVVRGGFSISDVDQDDEEAYDDYEDEDDESAEIGPASSEGSSAVVNISKRVLIFLGKATVATASAVKRAVQAAFQGEDMEEDEEAEEPSAISKVINVLKRMWNAALNPSGPEGPNEKQSSVSVKKEQKESPPDLPENRMADFGSYLSKAYGVKDERDEENRTRILGGTIGDALREARSQARLLVVYIPAFPPGKGKKTVPDQDAIKSLLSTEVSEGAEKRAKKKVDSGSFVLWGAKTGSPEAVTAIKRLRAKQQGSKGGKRPTLLVAYPAQVVDSSGVPKLVPRLLAQHHCSPPPSSEKMASWLNALRKRHSKQYSSMQHALKELQLFKERKEGYRSSVVSDVQRQEQEKKAEEERQAKEEAEKQRLEQLKERRKELKASLPKEPGNDVQDAMTIALRFGDGRSGQRRFTSDTPVATLFNWVDASYEIERETVVLSTMNGQKTFSWDEAGDMNLGETGLGRMTGLRVTQKKTEGDAIEEQTAQEAPQ